MGKAINRVLDAMQTLKVGQVVRSNVLAEMCKPPFKRAVVCAALVRKRIRPKINDADKSEVVTYDTNGDGLVKISLTRALTPTDLAIFNKPKQVKAPKAAKVPREKKERVPKAAKVSKREAKVQAKQAEEQLTQAPEEAKFEAGQEMDSFFGTPVTAVEANVPDEKTGTSEEGASE